MAVECRDGEFCFEATRNFKSAITPTLVFGEFKYIVNTFKCMFNIFLNYIRLLVYNICNVHIINMYIFNIQGAPKVWLHLNI